MFFWNQQTYFSVPKNDRLSALFCQLPDNLQVILTGFWFTFSQTQFIEYH